MNTLLNDEDTQLLRITIFLQLYVVNYVNLTQNFKFRYWNKGLWGSSALVAVYLNLQKHYEIRKSHISVEYVRFYNILRSSEQIPFCFYIKKLTLFLQIIADSRVKMGSLLVQNKIYICQPDLTKPYMQFTITLS